MMYRVKAIKNFTDKETGEHRIKDVSVFDCTLERYTFLKNNNAVVLVEEIEELKEEVLMPHPNDDVEWVVPIKNETTDKIAKVIFETVQEKPKKKKASKK